MNERERQLLYQMIKMARGNLIRMGNANTSDKILRLVDFVNEASRILGALEEIYGTRTEIGTLGSKRPRNDAPF